MSQTNMSLLDPIRDLIRKFVGKFAKFLNWLTRGKVTPNTITLIGLLGHLPAAYLIAIRHDFAAAILLVVFGLFDTLDGELARFQHRESTRGMLFDAASDRFKEVLIYTAAGYNLVRTGHPYIAVWAILACGASLSVSYVKAKGEAAYLSQGNKTQKINNVFKDGIMRFEVRIVILIIGLLTNYLGAALVIIAIMASYTSLSRLAKISRKLDVQD